MKDQSLLHKKLNSKEFIFTAETTPPDSADKNTLLEHVPRKFNKELKMKKLLLTNVKL